MKCITIISITCVSLLNCYNDDCVIKVPRHHYIIHIETFYKCVAKRDFYMKCVCRKCFDKTDPKRMPIYVIDFKNF